MDKNTLGIHAMVLLIGGAIGYFTASSMKEKEAVPIVLAKEAITPEMLQQRLK